ncbi:MAG: hypothetical protein ACRDM7_03945 [Thermoleophilaceae bacterium]
MLLPVIWEVRMHGVYDAGIANRERIILQASQATDMSQFVMTVGVPTSAEGPTVYPVRDTLFWFGGIALNPGDWIILFTGPGTPQQQRQPNGTVLHILYWGRAVTLFAGGNVVPVMFRYGGILVGATVPALPAPR